MFNRSRPQSLDRGLRERHSLERTTNWEAVVANRHLAVGSDVNALAYKLHRPIAQAELTTTSMLAAEKSADKIKAICDTNSAFLLGINLKYSCRKSSWNCERTISLQTGGPTSVKTVCSHTWYRHITTFSNTKYIGRSVGNFTESSP